MNTMPAIIRPFRSKPHVAIVAPASARIMNDALGLGINLNSGATSEKKRDVLKSAAEKLAGFRKSNETAEKWAARAQAALNERFPG